MAYNYSSGASYKPTVSSNSTSSPGLRTTLGTGRTPLYNNSGRANSARATGSSYSGAANAAAAVAANSRRNNAIVASNLASRADVGITKIGDARFNAQPALTYTPNKSLDARVNSYLSSPNRPSTTTTKRTSGVGKTNLANPQPAAPRRVRPVQPVLPARNLAPPKSGGLASIKKGIENAKSAAGPIKTVYDLAQGGDPKEQIRRLYARDSGNIASTTSGALGLLSGGPNLLAAAGGYKPGLGKQGGTVHKLNQGANNPYATAGGGILNFASGGGGIFPGDVTKMLPKSWQDKLDSTNNSVREMIPQGVRKAAEGVTNRFSAGSASTGLQPHQGTGPNNMPDLTSGNTYADQHAKGQTLTSNQGTLNSNAAKLSTSYNGGRTNYLSGKDKYTSAATTWNANAQALKNSGANKSSPQYQEALAKLTAQRQQLSDYRAKLTDYKTGVLGIKDSMTNQGLIRAGNQGQLEYTNRAMNTASGDAQEELATRVALGRHTAPKGSLARKIQTGANAISQVAGFVPGAGGVATGAGLVRDAAGLTSAVRDVKRSHNLSGPGGTTRALGEVFSDNAVNVGHSLNVPKIGTQLLGGALGAVGVGPNARRAITTPTRFAGNTVTSGLNAFARGSRHLLNTTDQPKGFAQTEGGYLQQLMPGGKQGVSFMPEAAAADSLSRTLDQYGPVGSDARNRAADYFASRRDGQSIEDAARTQRMEQDGKMPVADSRDLTPGDALTGQGFEDTTPVGMFGEYKDSQGNPLSIAVPKGYRAKTDQSFNAVTTMGEDAFYLERIRDTGGNPATPTDPGYENLDGQSIGAARNLGLTNSGFNDTGDGGGLGSGRLTPGQANAQFNSASLSSPRGSLEQLVNNKRDLAETYDVGKHGGARYAGQPVQPTRGQYTEARRDQKGGGFLTQLGTGTVFDPRFSSGVNQPKVGMPNRPRPAGPRRNHPSFPRR